MSNTEVTPKADKVRPRLAKIEKRLAGSSEFGKTYGIYADGVPIVMITTWYDGITSARADLDPEAIKFLEAFAPKGADE